MTRSLRCYIRTLNEVKEIAKNVLRNTYKQSPTVHYPVKRYDSRAVNCYVLYRNTLATHQSKKQFGTAVVHERSSLFSHNYIFGFEGLPDVQEFRGVSTGAIDK